MAITTVGGNRHLVLAIISGLAIVLATVLATVLAIVLATVLAIVLATVLTTVLATVLTTVLATYHLRSRRSWGCSIRKSAIRRERNTIRFYLIRATNSLHGVYIGLRFF